MLSRMQPESKAQPCIEMPDKSGKIRRTEMPVSHFLNRPAAFFVPTSMQIYFPIKQVNTKDMKNHMYTNCEIDVSGETSPGECTKPVQSKTIWQYLTMSFRRSSSWLLERMKAHNNRVLALGIHRQQRQDGNKT